MVKTSYQLRNFFIKTNHNKDTDIKSIQVIRASLSEQVTEQIQNMIIEGKIEQGERLPPERELAEQLGVSRTVIRETIQVLQERGLVKVLTGNGTYATRVESENITQSIGLFVRGKKHSFQDLLEVRKMLEIEIAGLAAARASEEDILQLKDCLQEMHKVLPEIRKTSIKLEEFVQADLFFHQCLAKASKNFLLPILLEPISDLLFEFSYEASTFPGAPEMAVAYHQSILECICAHDSRKCKEIMHDHLANTEKFLDLIMENLDVQKEDL